MDHNRSDGNLVVTSNYVIGRHIPAEPYGDDPLGEVVEREMYRNRSDGDQIFSGHLVVTRYLVITWWTQNALIH